MVRSIGVVLCGCTLLGCGGSGTSQATSTPPAVVDAGARDGGGKPVVDAGAHDAGNPPVVDAGAPPVGDAAPPAVDGAMPNGDMALPVADAGNDAGSDGGTDAGTTCTLTAPQAIVTSAKFGGAFQVDDQWLYYIDQGPTALWRVPKDGSAAPTSLAYLGTLDDDVYAWAYAVDASHIYVMDYGKNGMSLTNGGVDLYDKSMVLQRHVDAVSPSGGSCFTPLVWQMAVAAGNVYWIQQDGTRDPNCTATTDLQVVRLGPNDTSGTVIGTTNSNTNGLVATVDSVFISSPSLGVSRLPVSGGSAQTLTSDAPITLVSDGSAAYWNDSSNGIYRGDASGATLIAGPLFDQLDFDDGHTLYGVKGSGASGVVGRVANDGSGFATVASPANAVAVDDTYVYYADGTSTHFYRACK